MTKRTIEIEDKLEEYCDSACDEVKDLLIEYIEEKGLEEGDEVPCLHNDLDYSGRVHEIVDGSVPIYTKEITDLWYLYSNEFEQAYENAGTGENPLEHNGMAAIYFYIHEYVCNWYDEMSEEIFEEAVNPEPKVKVASK